MKTRIFKKATFITLLFVVFVGVTLLPGFYAGTSSSSGNPGHNGLEEGSKTWYIPYLAYAVNDQAKLIVTNLEDREADITLKVYAREGNLLDESHPFIHIGAKQAKTIDLFLLPQGTETLKLESEALLTASVIFEKAGLTRPVIIPAVKDTGKRLDFPQLVEGDAFYKEITLFNPNEFPCISPISIFAIDANGWEIGADILPSLLSFENRRILLRDIFDDDILQSATNFRIEADKSLLGLQVTDNSSGALVSLPAAVIAGKEWTLDISMNDDPGEIWLSIGIFNPENNDIPEDIGKEHLSLETSSDSIPVPEADTGFIFPLLTYDYSNNGGYHFKQKAKYPKGYVYHPGEDWNVPIKNKDCNGDKGLDIAAAANGKVVYVNKKSWGGLVIEHKYKDETWYSQYGHVQEILVKKGDTVKKGQKVAELGRVGTKCAHLHFEIREADHPNPTYGPYWSYGSSGLYSLENVDNWYEDPDLFIPSHPAYNDSGVVYGRLHENSPDGKALADATVSCGKKTTKTTADGSYILSDLTPGEQVLKFSKVGYIPYERSITIIENACVYAGDNYLIKEKKTLISISINGPFFVDENSRTFYIAKAKFSDGTEQTITDSCTWSENSKFASFDPNLKGLLITKEVEKNQRFLINITYLAVGKPAPYTAHQVVFIEDKPSSATLSSLKVIGPSEVDENFYADYKVRAKFSDNSIQWVTGSVTWSEDSPYIHMDTNIKNRMITGEVPSNQRVKLTATYVFNGISHPAEKYVDIIDKAASKTLTSISVSGPSSVNENSYADYSTTALFSDGSSQVVTASSIWEENSSYANMDPAIKGRLVTGEVSSNQTVTVMATFTYNGVTKSAGKNVIIIDTNTLPPYAIVGDNPTTNGWSFWEKPLLKLEAIIIGTTLKLIVTKIDGMTFETSGTVYFKVGTYEPWGFNRKIDYTTGGVTMEVVYEHDLSEYSGQYPKEFYVRHEPYEGGYSWVGPITVIQNSN